MYSGMQQAADHSVDNILSDNRFFQKTNEAYERYVFNTRKQKTRETVEDYIAALHTLASTCNFCDCLKDSLLRDRIVLGIKDSSTRKRLLQEADLNLETCIAMCLAAEATSPSQPVKTETWTEDTTAVEAGSVSSGYQRTRKKQDLSLNLRHCDPIMVSPDEVEISEVNFNTELDDSDDSALQCTTEQQSSGFPWDGTEHNKQDPAWSIEKEDSPDQPSAVYSTVQLMSDNTSGSLLSLNTSHECYLCSAAFVLVSSLELHLASVHGEKLHMVLPGSSTPDRCDAGNCSNTDIDEELDSHSKKPMTTDKGEDCGPNSKDGKNRKRPIVCGFCKKSFYKSSHLVRHKLKHCVESFVCDVCSKSCTGIRDLKQHKRTHAGDRPFKCQHCGKGFKLLGNLNYHVKSVHEGDKQLCDVCGAAFYTNSGFAIHRIIHTGEKPHVCSDCGKCFAQLGNLAQHRLSHTGIKTHMCADCGTSFVRSSELRRHRLSHTGEKPHVCSNCGKGFSRLTHLARHRLIHSGEKPHSCPHCPYACTTAQNLKKHIASRHQ